jgi:hypothetical protein
VALNRLTVALAAALAAAPLVAQSPEPAPPDTTQRESPRWGALITLGSPAAQRLRSEQLLGSQGTDSFLLRSASRLTPQLPAGEGLRWSLIAPELRVAWNSDIPSSLNNGSLWAGRGWSEAVMVGARAEVGRVSLILAPQFTHSANAPFDLVTAKPPGGTIFRPPWRTGLFSADLPIRFGEASFSTLDLGQSTLAVRVGNASLGLSTENQWWGPGSRNAIVLSDNAPGIPHAFARTRSPVDTRVGRIEAVWLVGTLTESLYFDDNRHNDLRAFNAVAATLQPAGAPGLTVGLARSVVAPIGWTPDLVSHSLDVLTDWSRPDTTTRASDDPDPEYSRDDRSMQIFSLFGRWVFPEDGLEVYLEWARSALPSSLRDLLVNPEETQGFTLGLQWIRPLGADGRAGRIHLETELTDLEQSRRALTRPVASFYASPIVVHGYTQRGRTIGAAIGPGASSQWLALRYERPRGGFGLSLGRIRWDNDAYYAQPAGRTFAAHDVSLLTGLTALLRLPGADLDGELTRETRLNYLFQNIPTTTSASKDAVDVHNLVLRFRVTPRP